MGRRGYVNPEKMEKEEEVEVVVALVGRKKSFKKVIV